MKESAGEANMTVITIVLIGLVAAAGAVLIPSLLNGMKDRSCCQQMGGYVDGANCKGGSSPAVLKDYYKKCEANSFQVSTSEPIQGVGGK